MLDFSQEDIDFRLEVRNYLQNNLPQSLAEKVTNNQRLQREDYIEWQDILARKNWYAIGWPTSAGGPGLTQIQRYLFELEYGALPCPHPCQFGVSMAGPVIFTYGNEEQKARFLPDIRENKTFWCQGYSEPGAGSDLASLKTSAVREGDFYRVNGQKTWTTWANWADWMFCLVKTDSTVKPQLGISFLLIDMRTPGITIRPIKTIDGDSEFNEVFFNDVMVPVENLIGEEGAGWTYAKFVLEFERFSMSGAGRSKRNLSALKQDIAQNPSLVTPMLSHKIQCLEIELLALEHMELDLLARSVGGENPGPEASKLKIRGTEIAQAISRLRLDYLGSEGLIHDENFLNAEAGALPLAAGGLSDGAMAAYLNQRKLTIWGGSNEIQRMILAKQVLEIG